MVAKQHGKLIKRRKLFGTSIARNVTTEGLFYKKFLLVSWMGLLNAITLASSKESIFGKTAIHVNHTCNSAPFQVVQLRGSFICSYMTYTLSAWSTRNVSLVLGHVTWPSFSFAIPRNAWKKKDQKEGSKYKFKMHSSAYWSVADPDFELSGGTFGVSTAQKIVRGGEGVHKITCIDFWFSEFDDKLRQ